MVFDFWWFFRWLFYFIIDLRWFFSFITTFSWCSIDKSRRFAWSFNYMDFNFITLRYGLYFALLFNGLLYWALLLHWSLYLALLPHRFLSLTLQLHWLLSYLALLSDWNLFFYRSEYRQVFTNGRRRACHCSHCEW